MALYTATGNPANRSALQSSVLRAEFALIAAAFAAFPDPAGNANELLKVNAAGNGFESIASLENFPIGSTTPSTGKFTTLQMVGAAGTSALLVANAGTGVSELRLQRTGGQASDWEFYLPSGSTDVRLFSGGADRHFFVTGSVTKFGVGGPPGAVGHFWTPGSQAGNGADQGVVVQPAGSNLQLMLGVNSAGNPWVQGWLSGTGVRDINIQPSGGSAIFGGGATLGSTLDVPIASSGATLLHLGRMPDDSNFSTKLFNGISGTAAGTRIGMLAGTHGVSTVNAYLEFRRGAGSTDGSLGLGVNGGEALHIDANRRLIAPAIHNNAAGAAGTTPILASGTYTPTLTNQTNVQASVAHACHWIRVGNVVHVAGKVEVDPTADSVVELGIALPIASALASEGQLAGTFARLNDNDQVSGVIRGDATNDRAQLVLQPVDVANHLCWFTFTYVVL